MVRFAAVVLLVVGACSSGSGFDDDYPVRPGGGGGGGGGVGGVDAAPPDGGAMVVGHVCVVTDLRSWTTGCAGTGFANLTVTIGTETAMTEANGRFTIAEPTGTGLLVRVEGAGIVTSLHPYVPDAIIIDAVAPTTQAWADLLAANSIVIATGNGSAMGELQVDGNPIGGLVGESNPAPGAGAGAVYYDNPLDKDAWDVDATDVAGKALFADLPPGVDIAITETYMTLQMTGTIRVVDDAIFFFTINLDTTLP